MENNIRISTANTDPKDIINMLFYRKSVQKLKLLNIPIDIDRPINIIRVGDDGKASGLTSEFIMFNEMPICIKDQQLYEDLTACITEYIEDFSRKTLEIDFLQSDICRNANKIYATTVVEVFVIGELMLVSKHIADEEITNSILFSYKGCLFKTDITPHNYIRYSLISANDKINTNIILNNPFVSQAFIASNKLKEINEKSNNYKYE